MINQSHMMKTNICIWNVRGLGREKRRWGVKDLIKRWKVSIFSLQETKVQEIDRRMALNMWGRRSFSFIHKPASRRSRGILVAWDTKLMEVLDHCIGEFSISVLCWNKVEDKEWAFFGVYGQCNQRELSLLWEELSDVRSAWVVPWSTGGDFNAIRNPRERLGATRMTRHMKQFDSLI